VTTVDSKLVDRPIMLQAKKILARVTVDAELTAQGAPLAERPPPKADVPKKSVFDPNHGTFRT